MVEVTHGNLELGVVVGLIAHDLCNRAVKLLFRFSEMKKNGVLIHKCAMPNIVIRMVDYLHNTGAGTSAKRLSNAATAATASRSDYELRNCQ